MNCECILMYCDPYHIIVKHSYAKYMDKNCIGVLLLKLIVSLKNGKALCHYHCEDSEVVYAVATPTPVFHIFVML